MAQVVLDQHASRTKGSEILLRAKARLEIERLNRDEKYWNYTPTGKLQEFIDMFGSGKTFVNLLSAANGIGKTHGAVNILAHIIWPCSNPWFTESLYKEWPYPKKIRITSDPTTLIQTIIPAMKDQFPKGRYQTYKMSKPFEAKWVTDTGWEIYLMSYEQDVREFEASTLGLAWFDEPPPKDKFIATVARLRLGGQVMITATPLSGSAWLYDDIVANPDPLIRERGDSGYVEANVESACKLHGVRGFLEHDHILKMVNQYTDEDKQARIFGKFQHLIGLVYKQFKYEVHVIKPFHVSKDAFSVVQYLDPHPRTPDAVVWLAVDNMGTKYVIDELFIEGGTEQIVQEIMAKDDKYRVVTWKADPAAFIVDKHSNQSFAQQLNKYSNGVLTYQPATKDREAANRRIGDALNYTAQNGVMLKPPELYIFDTCRHLIYEIQHWQWDDYAGKTTERKGLKQTPMDKDDHLIECLGRALFDEPTFIPNTVEVGGPGPQPIKFDPFD